MKKRVISWLLTVVMVVSLLPTSVLADMLAADQEQQTQQEQIAPVDTENTVPAGNEETQEQQEPAEEVPVSRSARSGGADSAPTAINDADGFKNMVAGGSYTLTGVTRNGQPVQDDDTFTVSCLSTPKYMEPLLADGSCAFEEEENTVRNAWLDYVSAGSALLAEPESYIVLRDENG